MPITPNLPPRTKKLLIAVAGLAVFLPIWSFVVLPRLFPQVACVITQPNGAVEKAWGEAACLDNGKPTVVLRSQD